MALVQTIMILAAAIEGLLEPGVFSWAHLILPLTFLFAWLCYALICYFWVVKNSVSSLVRIFGGTFGGASIIITGGYGLITSIPGVLLMLYIHINTPYPDKPNKSVGAAGNEDTLRCESCGITIEKNYSDSASVLCDYCS